jgi:hypothetical protein
MYYSSLLGIYLSHEENEVLWRWLMEVYLKHFIFFLAYKFTQ